MRRIVSLLAVLAMAALAASSLAVAAGAAPASGGVRAWGNNEVGQLGDGTNNSSSVRVATAIGGVKSVKGGCYHSLAVKK